MHGTPPRLECALLFHSFIITEPKARLSNNRNTTHEADSLCAGGAIPPAAQIAGALVFAAVCVCLDVERLPVADVGELENRMV